MRAISEMARVSYVRRDEVLGLGHAVLQARDLVGDEPFAVMLSDDIIDAETPGTSGIVLAEIDGTELFEGDETLGQSQVQ